MITENKNNYYEILEVAPSATQHEILLAYQKAKKTYSQSNYAILNAFSTQELTDLQNLIEEAYAVLSKQEYRIAYEMRRNEKSYSKANITFDGIKDAVENIKSETVENLVHQQQVQLVAHENTGDVSSLQTQPASTIDTQFEFEINNQTQWTGDFLKKVREYKKISIDKLQETTKVNPWYLKALETMDYKNLPATVFVRGYVLQMAKQLGLNEKEVADSYIKIYKDMLEHNQP